MRQQVTFLLYLGILLMTIGLYLFLQWLMGLLNWPIMWLNPGLALGFMLLSFDVVAYAQPDIALWEPIFTNLQDTAVVLISLLIFCAIVYFPEQIQQNDSPAALLFYPIGAATAVGICYLLGTDNLRSR